MAGPATPADPPAYASPVARAGPAYPPPANAAPAFPTPTGGGPTTPGAPNDHEWSAPGQRSGTTYGGSGSSGAGQMTVAIPGGNPLENSGSLTGHILSQGSPDWPVPRSNTTKVVLIGLVLLVVLVAVGLLAATLAGDAVSDMFGGLIDG